MPGNPLVRFDEGRVGRPEGVALSPTLPSWRLGERLKKAAMTENAIAKEIVDAAFPIHTTLGPGLLESVYHAVLAYELAQRGLRTVSQQAIPVVYGKIRIEDRKSTRLNSSHRL